MESWGAHDRLTVLPPGLLKSLLPKPIFSLPSPSHHLTSIFLVAKNTLFQKYQGKITSNFHNVLIIKREFYLLRKVWKRSFKSVTGKKFSFVLRSEFQSVSGAIWSGGNAAVRPTHLSSSVLACSSLSSERMLSTCSSSFLLV